MSGEGSPISLSLDADDPDTNQLTFTASGLPEGLSIDPGTGEISGAVGFGAAASSPYNVTVSVTDSIAPPVARSFTWTIVDTNRNPQLGPIADRENLEGDTGITFDLSGLASDPDGDALSFSATGLPLGLTISAVGVITGDLAVGDGGTYAVSVTATDDGTPALGVTTSFAWEVFGPDATLTVTETVGSTLDDESMVLVNDSRGNVRIESIAIDLRTAVYPDMVWDPNGTGGDIGWKCLTATAISGCWTRAR